MVYLEDPKVQTDASPLEPALRAIPMGGQNGMFCGTELGAKRVGLLQNLLATCKSHDFDAYDYLVDVPQRVSHPLAACMHILTPRIWKSLSAPHPPRAPLAQATSKVK